MALIKRAGALLLEALSGLCLLPALAMLLIGRIMIALFDPLYLYAGTWAGLFGYQLSQRAAHPATANQAQFMDSLAHLQVLNVSAPIWFYLAGAALLVVSVLLRPREFSFTKQTQ